MSRSVRRGVSRDRPSTLAGWDSASRASDPVLAVVRCDAGPFGRARNRERGARGGGLRHVAAPLPMGLVIIVAGVMGYFVGHTGAAVHHPESARLRPARLAGGLADRLHPRPGASMAVAPRFKTGRISCDGQRNDPATCRDIATSTTTLQSQSGRHSTVGGSMSEAMQRPMAPMPAWLVFSGKPLASLERALRSTQVSANSSSLWTVGRTPQTWRPSHPANGGLGCLSSGQLWHYPGLLSQLAERT